MSIIRYQSPELSNWPPFDRLSTLREEMNRLFDTSFPGAGSGEATLFSGWSPALDVIQSNDAVTVNVELPGLKKEDIEISLEKGVLSISGERRHEEKLEEGENFRSERYFGRFHRSVAIPTEVEADKVKASYTDGVLTVTLPKAEEAKPKQIDVNVT